VDRCSETWWTVLKEREEGWIEGVYAMEERVSGDAT
jgi:hypothetical protein